MESPDDGAEEHTKKKKKPKPGSFQGLGLSQATYKAVMRMGYKTPTPIQRKTIPTILEGQDMVAMARTGSGKTAAFLIPIIERLSAHSASVGFRAVVLSPTRELAMQTAKFCRQLGKFRDLRCCLLVGGQGMEAQFEHLANNPDIIIATPGRLMHHIMEAELSLSRVEILVFDEADRLFELGFAEQLQKVMDACPQSRQCLLFSATLPAQLVSFSRAGIKDPAFVRLDVETSISESLDLWYLFVRKDEKLAAAVSMLRRFHQNEKTTIMFVATKHHVEFFGELLQQLGLTVAVVYGTMDQVARQEQVARFRHKKARILVTTDVAARGVDIPLLDHVLNFDFPPSAKLFIHRCGRTARAGRSGLAASLVTLEDLPYTIELMTFFGHKLRVPNAAEPEEAEKDSKMPVLGAMPPLDHEVETLDALLSDEGSLIQSLQKSMLASYHLYNKTRPSASKSSVARAKQLLDSVGGPAMLQGALHPAFQDQASAAQHGHQPGAVATGPDMSLVRELRSFRPKIEKIGNVLSTEAMRKMEQAKLDAAAVASSNFGEYGEYSATTFGGSSSSSSGIAKAGSNKKRRRSGQPEEEADTSPQASQLPSNIKPRDRPRLSKKARQLGKQAGSAGTSGEHGDDAGDFDVTVDGAAWQPGNAEKKSRKEVAAAKAQEGQFYLTTERNLDEEAKERGLDMEQYQMDLLPDDENNIQKAKSVMRWDAKKKKYFPTMVSVDGRAVKGQRRNESGKKVKGDGEKTNLYQKWSKATKRRIQKVGEMEQVASLPLGKLQKSQAKTMEFGDDGDIAGSDAGESSSRARKPVVPFHGKIDEKHLTHKQKRMLKKRSQQDVVRQGGKEGAKSELKTPQDIQQARKKKESNKLKQKPWLRKDKAKQTKEARQKMHEDRQMKYGARTKSKMLIIEGPKKWQKKGRRPQKGYGSNRSI
eukprot:TRINITY_DN59697_c0_g1_i1.p1 TRINITY_DN59697_c0_g1~~TRINITY_DN59697_c0_g1_i1.p1  ORF type:complete len:932 (-),score=189.82 TRINITY_DN59697_c0_g1_i1:63-2858(-)